MSTRRNTFPGRARLLLAVAVATSTAFSLASGCKSGHGGGSTGPQASGVAHLVHGPSVPASFTSAPASLAALTDGKWYVSPDQVKVHVTRINFEGQAGSPGTGADLANCLITFNKTTPSMSNLLDCPFAIDAGTYIGMTVFVSGTAEILVSDVTNGIYTDPTSGTGLRSSAPAVGAAFIPYSRPLGSSGVQQLFGTPLVVGAADSITLAVTLDAVQTLHVNVSGGGSTLTLTDLDQFPVNVFPTLNAPGVARYFTSANTSSSYNDSLVLANILRIYFTAGSSGQPTYAITEQVASPLSACIVGAATFGANAADPATTETNSAGMRIGGWLGRDGAGTNCWVLPADPAYASYHAYLTIPDVTVLGNSATLSCQSTSTPTPPLSGATYASGCPAITATASTSLMLVAD